MPKKYITLVFHGSRVSDANLFAIELIESLCQEHPDFSCNLGFLELATPSVHAALSHHLHQGARHINVYPLFLTPGKHTSHDLPEILNSFTATNINCQISQHDFIGNHPLFKSLLKNMCFTN